MKLNKCKDVVTDILTEKPETRDCDVLLIQKVWEKQSGVIDLLSQPVGFLFDLMRNKKISDSSSIRRLRRKLQELCPNLRGIKYAKRHKAQEDVMYDLNTLNAESIDPTYWRNK